MEQSNWHFKIHEEKFNSSFANDCDNFKLGKRVNGGILTSKELAYLFMTFLADEMANENNGNPITDIREYDGLLNFLRIGDPEERNKFTAMNAVIQFAMPANIEQTPISKFIEFRNKDGISALRRFFIKSLDNYFEKVENGFDPSEYLTDIKKTNWELAKEIGLFFGGIASCSLGAAILMKDPMQLEIYKQFTETSILMIAGISSIEKAWLGNKEKKAARRYLSRISQIR